MTREGDEWERARLSLVPDERLWELLHENSKTHRYSGVPSDSVVAEVMASLWEELPYLGHRRVPLPPSTLLSVPLGDVLVRRRTPQAFRGESLSLADLSAILLAGYGAVDRPSAVGSRVFRVAPSAGALYPLELYVYPTAVDGLDRGLYHLHAIDRELRLLADTTPGEIASVLVQPELATVASAIVFITAVFERSTFKYGERGYRFVLLEAGHVAQNMNLAAAALGKATVNIGGFFDAEVDRLLGIDGIEHGTIYVLAVGQP